MQHRIPDRASNMVGHVLRNAALYFVWEHVLHIPPLCSGWGFPLDFTLWNCNWKQQRLPIPFAILIFSICSNVRTCLTVLPSMPDLEVDTQSHADHHDRRLEAALQRCWRRLAGLTFSHSLSKHGIAQWHWYAHPICSSSYLTSSALGPNEAPAYLTRRRFIAGDRLMLGAVVPKSLDSPPSRAEARAFRPWLVRMPPEPNL